MYYRAKRDAKSLITSVFQRGRHVPNNQLLPELPGSLKDLKNVEYLGREFTEFLVGVWEQPDGSKTTVTVKRFININTDTDLFYKRIKREVVIWRDINHPNILPLIGYKTRKEFPSPLLISPWCPNGNIAEFIENHPGLTDVQRLKLLCGAARGLAHLHSRAPPIVHGNIIPQSVIIQDNLEAALCDTGLASVLASQVGLGLSLDPWIAQDGRYGSWKRTAQKASEDVYGFGGLILLTMSGERPFGKMPGSICVRAILNGQNPSPTDHPRLPEADPLWSLLRRCWSRDPSESPTSDTILQKLERILEERLAHSTCLIDE